MAQSNDIERETILEIVLTSLHGVIEQSGEPIQADPSEETALIGRDAAIDSIGLVTLIIDIEQEIENRTGQMLTLANDRAMSQKNSPFLSVRTLTDYVVTLMAEDAPNG